MRNTLCEFLIVIAAVAKVSCKHGLWLVARVNTNAGNKDTMYFLSCIFSFTYTIRNRKWQNRLKWKHTKKNVSDMEQNTFQT